MLRESHTAVVARNETWSGACATEPYEAGWASEAVIFMRTLSSSGLSSAIKLQVQISPDGIRWLDEGSTLLLPDVVDGLSVARVKHFGNWLRVSGTLSSGATAKVLVTLHLK